MIEITTENLNLITQQTWKFLFKETSLPDNIKDLLKDTQELKIALYTHEDFEFIYRYKGIIERSYFYRLIVKYQGKILLIYTENTLHLLEILINNQQTKNAIKYLNTQGFDLSFEDDSLPLMKLGDDVF